MVEWQIFTKGHMTVSWEFAKKAPECLSDHKKQKCCDLIKWRLSYLATIPNSMRGGKHAFYEHHLINTSLTVKQCWWQFQSECQPFPVERFWGRGKGLHFIVVSRWRPEAHHQENTGSSGVAQPEFRPDPNKASLEGTLKMTLPWC